MTPRIAPLALAALLAVHPPVHAQSSKTEMPADESAAAPAQADPLMEEIERYRALDAEAYGANDYPRAAQASAKVVELAEPLGDTSFVYARALNDHALNLMFSRRAAEAEPLMQKALVLYQAQLGSDHPEALKARANLGAVLFNAGKVEEAVDAYRIAYDGSREQLGMDNPATRDVAANLIDLLYRLARRDEAIPVQAALLESMTTEPGADHPDTLLEQKTLASLLIETGQYVAARDLLRDAMPRLEAALGKTHPLTTESLALLSVSFERTGDYVTAEPLARDALDRARAASSAEDPTTFLSALALGNIRIALARFAEAEADLKPVYEISLTNPGEASDISLALARGLATAYLNTGQFREGIALMKRADGVARQHYPPTSTFRHVIQGTLVALLVSAGSYSEAEPLSAALLDTIRETRGLNNRDALNVATNHAMLLTNLGRYAEAEALYEQSSPVLAGLLGSEHQEVLALRNNLALVHIYQGRFVEAEANLLETQAIALERYGRRHPTWQGAAANLALLLVQQRRFAEAEAVYEAALAELTEVLGPDHASVLQTRANIADMKLQQRDFAATEQILESVLELGSKQSSGQSQLLTIARTNLGIAQLLLGKSAQAEANLRQVVDLPFETLPRDHPIRFAAQSRLALVHVNRDEFATADAIYTDLAQNQIATFGLPHPNSLDTLSILVRARIANTAAGVDRLAPARMLLEGLRQRIGSGDADLRSEAQSTRERSNLVDYYSKAADAMWLAREQDLATVRNEAFVALQGAIAGGANDAIARMAARGLADSIDPALGDLVRERETLSTAWSENARKYNEALGNTAPGSAEVRANLTASRTAMADRIAAIDQRLRAEFPQYFALVRPEPLAQPEAEALLAPDEAALLIVPSDAGTHVFAVTSTATVWHRAEQDDEAIAASVKRLLWDVGANIQVDALEDAEWSNQGEGAYPFDRGTAFALYQQLIAPVADTIRGKRHVFIAAAGALSSLPFGMLVTQKPEGADGDPASLRGTRWFADSHALIQIPSLQSLKFLRDRLATSPTSGGAARQPFLGFGDPVLEGEVAIRGGGGRGVFVKGQGRDPRRARPQGLAAAEAFAPGTTRSGGGVVNIAALRQMARLPGTAIELAAMRTALGASPASVLTGAQATEANVRAAKLSDARILALATHGLMAGEVEGAAEPGLVFTPPALASEADDGLLTASEVAALKLDADWVILSACNTAAGDGSQGAPGLSGLARAFFYAGARTLLASHWPVRDDVAAKMTVRTIEIARDNPALSRAEAFAQAMREIRNDTSQDSDSDTLAHPNAWAPFTLIGDGAR
ncbi:tetratricopeptide repeat protein [Blastomonas fulva]|jgi:CHAT domain-containing protein|uniref:CHAT domain-containing tetratricopeptide repeat protein n=1 Tax=Blastomonas fulva TaxID=1550728 RepID=UPI003D2B41AE